LTVLFNKYNSIFQMKKNEMALHVARVGRGEDAYMVSVAKPEGRTSHGRPRHIWEDNIKMDFQEVGWGHGLD
jgi:hypothetical protein